LQGRETSTVESIISLGEIRRVFTQSSHNGQEEGSSHPIPSPKVARRIVAVVGEVVLEEPIVGTQTITPDELSAAPTSWHHLLGLHLLLILLLECSDEITLHSVARTAAGRRHGVEWSGNGEWRCGMTENIWGYL
jgi:hypothetical protein